MTQVAAKDAWRWLDRFRGQDHHRLARLEREIRGVDSDPESAAQSFECNRCNEVHAASNSALNTEFRIFLMRRLLSGSRSIRKTRRFARVGGWVLLTLSALMALVGLAAIAYGVYSTVDQGRPTEEGLLAAGAGGVDLMLFLFFRPMGNIKRLLADLVQLEMAVNGFQTRVSLELLAFRRACPKSVLEASRNIGDISKEHLQAIESYYTTVGFSWAGARVAKKATGEIKQVQGIMEDLRGRVDRTTVPVSDAATDAVKEFTSTADLERVASDSPIR